MGLFSFESKQVKEWKKLAKSGDMEAQYHLARAYANGKGASINMKRAVDYCVQSAEQEYAPAQALLAHFYGYGKGVDKNYEEDTHRHSIMWVDVMNRERARKRILKRQCIGIC